MLEMSNDVSNPDRPPRASPTTSTRATMLLTQPSQNATVCDNIQRQHATSSMQHSLHMTYATCSEQRANPNMRHTQATCMHGPHHADRRIHTASSLRRWCVANMVRVGPQLRPVLMLAGGRNRGTRVLTAVLVLAGGRRRQRRRCVTWIPRWPSCMHSVRSCRSSCSRRARQRF